MLCDEYIGLVTKNMGESERISHLSGIFLHGNGRVQQRLARTLVKDLDKHTKLLAEQEAHVALLATRLQIPGPDIATRAREIHNHIQDLAKSADVMTKKAKHTLELLVSTAKCAFLEQLPGSISGLTEDQLAILPQSYTTVASDAKAVGKVRSRIKILKKSLGLPAQGDLTAAQTEQMVADSINGIEKRLQLDLALFWAGKRRAANTNASSKQRTQSRKSLYAKVVTPLNKSVGLRNKLAALLPVPKPPLVVKDLLSGDAMVYPTSTATPGSISDDEFAEQRRFRDAVYLRDRLDVQVTVDELYMANYLQTYTTMKRVLLARHEATQVELDGAMSLADPTTGYSHVLEILGRMADIGTGLKYANAQLHRATLPGRSRFPAHVIEEHNQSSRDVRRSDESCSYSGCVFLLK